MLKRINEALPGLVVSILLYGVIVELIGVWFVKDRIAYSIGVCNPVLYKQIGRAHV